MENSNKKMSPKELLAHKRAQSRKSSQKLRMKQKQQLDQLLKQHEELQSSNLKLKTENDRMEEETARLEQVNAVLRASSAASAAMAARDREAEQATAGRLELCRRSLEVEPLLQELERRLQVQRIEAEALQAANHDGNDYAILAAFMAQNPSLRPTQRRRTCPTHTPTRVAAMLSGRDGGSSTDFLLALNSIQSSQLRSSLSAFAPVHTSYSIPPVIQSFAAAVPSPGTTLAAVSEPPDAPLERLEQLIRQKLDELC